MKSVRKVTILFVMWLMLGGMAASAQTVTSAQWNADGSALSIEYDLMPQQTKSSYSYIVTPMLCSPTDTLTLEPQIWRGSRNAAKLHRAHILNKVDEGDYLLVKDGETVHRSASFSSSDLKRLGNGQLSMAFRTEMEGCCEVEDMGKTVVDLPRYTNMSYKPQFAYVQPKVETMKTRNLSGQAYIEFMVNRTDIRSDFRSNQVELKKIQNTIDSVKNDADIQVQKIFIKGFASPEGSYQTNDRLAAGRTEALRKYVQGLYDFPASTYETDHVAEDWDGLVAYVEKSNLQSKDDILDIIRNSGLQPDQMEQRIKSRHAQDYQFLLQNAYPSLRHTDYRIEYVIRSFEDVAEIKRLVKTQPQKLSLQEFFMAAQDYQLGSADFNEVFETAVRIYPDNETANLNATVAALHRGDLTQAENYLQKAGNSAHAQYAKGMLAAMKKDYQTALTLFLQAQSGGVAEATDAVNQMHQLLDN